MQYHLNGFRAGNPDLAAVERERLQDLPEEVDVLIVGSGPAGLVLAAQLSAFPGISVRIVERNPGPLVMGRADGIACRTVEMFHAFGFAQALVREAYQVNETSFWRPDAHDQAKITRSGRVQDVADDLSECPHVILNQGRVHDYLLQHMGRAAAPIEPDYECELIDLERDDTEAFPLRATLSVAGDTQREMRAKYVVGCDGARSVVRKLLGRELSGDAANHAWGVMDVLAKTDFPDIRLKAAIKSDSDGSILLIPREGGYMVRLYVDLGDVDPSDRQAIRSTTSEEAIATAKRVLHPYTLDVQDIVWFSVYEVGQRLTDRFDDLDDGAPSDAQPRIFIAGDACHTHSAKAGLGLNVSMQDAFNLAWKLAAVLEGRSEPGLLCTYNEERQPVAQELIDFDREWSAMMAAPPKDPESPDAAEAEASKLQEQFVRQGRYTAGVATRYGTLPLTGGVEHEALATGFLVGTRFHSSPVVRLADAQELQLGHVHQADGRWRVYLFEGADRGELADLCEYLEQDPSSPLLRFTPAGADIDSVLDVRAVVQGSHRDTEIGELPSLLRPCKGKLGLVDYTKAFTSALACGDDIYQRRGIDREQGAIVVVRPDQYVSQVLPLRATKELSSYFGEVLVEP